MVASSSVLPEQGVLELIIFEYHQMLLWCSNIKFREAHSHSDQDVALGLLQEKVSHIHVAFTNILNENWIESHDGLDAEPVMEYSSIIIGGLGGDEWSICILLDDTQNIFAHLWVSCPSGEHVLAF